MRQATYTPGPWFIHWGSKGPEVHSNPDEGDSPIADIPASENPNAEQDARLIASAPEMLAALEEVQRDIARAAQNNVIWPDTRRMIAAAIDRATGRQAKE